MTTTDQTLHAADDYLYDYVTHLHGQTVTVHRCRPGYAQGAEPPNVIHPSSEIQVKAASTPRTPTGRRYWRWLQYLAGRRGRED